jgi:integrase
MGVLRYKPVGALTQIISDYIDFKRLQGFKYLIEENVLCRFSALSQKHEFTGMEIPQSLLTEWFKRRPNEKVGTFKSRCSIIAGLLVYAKDYGYRASIPELPRVRCENYAPYIFTEHEISKFFHACDSLPPYSGSRRHEIIPVLFRILYSCGLRSSEAAELRIADVDLKNGVLTIREPKNRKDRYVPMPKSLTNAMRRFHALSHDAQAQGEDFFFKASTKIVSRDTMCINGSAYALKKRAYCITARVSAQEDTIFATPFACIH